MASTHTLTGNVYDLTGATLGATGVRVTVVTNLPAKSALIDKTTNSIHLGGKHADLDPSTGLFTIDLIDTSATDLNVAANTLQYEVRAEYVNPATRVRSTWTSGWFPFTADANLADITTDVEPIAVESASGYALEAKGYRDEAAEISGLTGEDAAVAFLVADENSDTAAALSATIGRGARRAAARGQGVICFTWDDGYDTWGSFMDLADSLGQRHTLAPTSNRLNVAGGVTSAEVADWHSRGHEIASHSATHPDVSTQAVGTRVNEYQDSKTALEAITGAGTVTSFIYPYGGRSETTDRECYGRYDRVVDYQVGATVPLSERHSVYHIPRIQLRDATGEMYVRLAASQPVVVTLALHNPGGNMFGGGADVGVTDAEVRRLMQLAYDLGIPCVTLAEAFPAKSAVMGFSFEESGTVGGALWRPSGSGTNANTFVTPDTGIAGTRAGQITTVNTFGAGFRQLVDVTPGRSYTLSGRARITAGTPTLPGYVRARLGTPATYAGPKSADNLDASSTVVASSSDITSTSWTRFSVTYVVPQGVRMLEIQLVAREQTGITAQFDHIHFGPTELGAFG